MKNRKTATKLTVSSHHHNALYRLIRGPVAAHGDHLVRSIGRWQTRFSLLDMGLIEAKDGQYVITERGRKAYELIEEQAVNRYGSNQIYKIEIKG